MVRHAALIAFWSLAAPALAAGEDVSAFFRQLDGNPDRPLCLTFADETGGPVSKARLLVSGRLDGGKREARMTLTPKGANTFRFGLECRVGGPGGKFIECSIPCGGDAMINLTVGKDGAVKADIDIADGVLGKVGAVKTDIRMVSEDAAACLPKDDARS